VTGVPGDPEYPEDGPRLIVREPIEAQRRRLRLMRELEADAKAAGPLHPPAPPQPRPEPAKS